MVSSRIVLLLLVIALGWSQTDAQSLEIGPMAGVTCLLSTQSNNGSRDIYTKTNGGFGFGPWAPSVGMELRFSPPRGHVTLSADAMYSRLTGDGTVSWVDSFADSHGEGDYKSDLYVATVGAQWNFLPGPVRPYLGGRVLWAHLSDVRKNSWVAPVPGFDHLGLGILAGTTFDLAQSVSLDVCARTTSPALVTTQTRAPTSIALVLT